MISGEIVGLFCKTHATADMIDVRHKTCQYPECTIRANFNIPGETEPIFCKSHASLEMIDLNHTICQHTGCTTQSTFNTPGKSPEFCAEHRTPGMIANPTARCKHPKCKQQAIYGDLKGLVHCELHKMPEDKNMAEQSCKSCSLLYILDDKDLCENCNPESFKKTALAKQNEVFDYLDAHDLPGTSTDKVIEGGKCGRERPDRVFELPDRVIILEIDEEQHKGRPCECEQTRMVNITHAFGGLPVFWIRYNPDNYKSRAQMKSRTHRMKILEKVIEHTKTIEASGLACVLHLYFDGWVEATVAKNGKTAIHVCCDCRIKLQPRALEDIEFKSVDKNHETALMACLDAGHSDSAAQLLKNGNCNVEYVSPEGDTALIVACKRHDYANAMRILELNPGNEHSKNCNNAYNPTALLRCLDKNTSESLVVARKILDTQHENVGIVPGFPKYPMGLAPTALVLACKNNHQDIALKILESPHANPHWNGCEGSALELACKNKMHAVAMKILETENPGEIAIASLFWACKHNMHEVAMKILDTGKARCLRSYFGNTPLIWACKHRDEELAVRIAALPDCNKESKNRTGKTALDYAKFYCLTRIVNALRAKK